MSDRRRRTRRSTGRRRRLAIGGLIVTALLVGAGAVGYTVRERRNRDNVWRLHDSVSALFAAGEYAQAADACRRILEQRPGDAVAHYNLGAALRSLGQDEDAWVEIGRAAALDPNMDAAHLALARRCVEEGREEDALAELALVVAHPPTPAEAHALMAHLLRRRGETARCLPHLRVVFESPDAAAVDRVEAGLQLAGLHQRRSAVHRNAAGERSIALDCLQRARTLAEEALAAGGPARELRSSLARVLLALDRPGEALAQVEQALELAEDGPGRAALHALRAHIYWASGAVEESLAEMERALAGSPPADAFLAAADFHASRQEFAAAVTVLSAGTAAFPADEALGLALADQLFAAGRPDEAQEECRRLAGAAPFATAPLVRLGDLRRARGDLAGARESYEQALNLDAKDVTVRLRVAGTAFSEAGRAEGDAEAGLREAEDLATQILDLEPDHPGALIALAKVGLARARPDDRDAATEAHALLVRALDQDPFSWEGRSFLALAELLRGRPDEAVLQFEKVLAALPDERPEMQLLVARAYLENRQPEIAADRARRGLAALPADVQGRQVLKTALLAIGDLDGALAVLATLEGLQPEHLDHLLEQAFLFGRKGDVATAEERFSRAEAVAEGFEDVDRRSFELVRITEAKARFRQLAGDMEGAIGAFEGLVARDGSAEGHVRYGRFLLGLGREKDAEQQFQRAIAVAPGQLEPRRALCELYFARGQVTPVLLNQVNEILRLHASAPDVDYLRGKLSLLQEDYRVAVDLLTRYLDVRGDDPDGHYSLGVALGRTGDFEGAVARLTNAERLSPGNVAVRAALAKMRYGWAARLIERGRFAEAQAALQQASAEDPGSAEPRQLLAGSYALSGNFELSEREVRYLLRQDPGDPALRRMLASIFAIRGDNELAIREMRDLVAAHPDDWRSWGYLAGLLIRTNDLPEAEKAARSARAAAPAEPTSITALIHALVEQGRFDDAEREVRAAAEAVPEEVHYPYLLCVVLQQQEKLEPALAAAREALSRSPGHAASARMAIFILATRMKDLPGALAFARESAARAPDSLEIAHNVAWLEYRSGDVAGATDSLRSMLERELPFVPSVVLLAGILRDAGDGAGAREVLARGEAVYPTLADLPYLRGETYLRDAAREGAQIVEPERGLAVAAFRRALELKPRHGPTLNNLAYLVSLDDATLNEALELSAAAVDTAPGYVPFLDTAGGILVKLGRHDRAITAFQAALGRLEEERTHLADPATVSSMDPQEHRIRVAKRDQLEVEVRAHLDEAVRLRDERR